MSQHSSFPTPARSIPRVRTGNFLLDEEDAISSLQALIDILRKPRDHACPHCLGSGSYLSGGDCEHCFGSGKRPVARI